MEMHIFGAMYGLGNKLTLMAMVPYVDKSMDLVNRMGRKFTTRAKGLGDIKITGMRTLYSKESKEMPRRYLSMNLGLSLPEIQIKKTTHCLAIYACLIRCNWVQAPTTR